MADAGQRGCSAGTLMRSSTCGRADCANPCPAPAPRTPQLEALEYVHAAQYVFVDVNPGNIMFGATAASSAAAIVTTSAKGKGSGSASSSATPPLAGESCYLVDFGMAQRYTAFMGVPVPATVNGTPLYTSVASLLGWGACSCTFWWGPTV